MIIGVLCVIKGRGESSFDIAELQQRLQWAALPTLPQLSETTNTAALMRAP